MSRPRVSTLLAAPAVALLALGLAATGAQAVAPRVAQPYPVVFTAAETSRIAHGGCAAVVNAHGLATNTCYLTTRWLIGDLPSFASAAERDHRCVAVYGTAFVWDFQSHFRKVPVVELGMPKCEA